MNPAKYRHRVVLQRKEAIKDVEGNIGETWVDVGMVWAKAKQLKGKRAFVAQAEQTISLFEIFIRYKREVTADMRIVYGMRILQIQSVIDVDESHKELQLLCKGCFS